MVHSRPPGSRAPVSPDGSRIGSICGRSSALRGPLRDGQGLAARRRADALDGQVGRPVPALRRGRQRGALPVRRRPRLRRLLPGRYRGAMAGHGPPPTIAAVERQLRDGITHMLPTEDAAWVGEELTRRFGVGSWQFALSASDANRWSLRLARQITGRSKVVVHDHCYHGSVDEAIAMLDEDGSRRPGARLGRAPGRRGADDPGRRIQRRGRASRPRSPTATSRPSCSSRP